MNKFKISEIFESIQGEGKYTGYPMLFIRLSGCTRKCSFCDTSYHTKVNKELSVKEVVEVIKKSKKKIVCWTGGEPLIQVDLIEEVFERLNQKLNSCLGTIGGSEDYYKFHLETNGDVLEDNPVMFMPSGVMLWHYISCSPKDKNVARKISKTDLGAEIKIVTDLKKVGVDMIKYATMLMPLSTYNKKKDIEIMQKVWQYCAKNNLKYSPRIHYLVFGKKKNI